MITDKIFSGPKNMYLSDSGKDFGSSYGGAWIEGRSGSDFNLSKDSIFINQGSDCAKWGESSKAFISWFWVSSMGSFKKSSSFKFKKESVSTISSIRSIIEQLSSFWAYFEVLKY